MTVQAPAPTAAIPAAAAPATASASAAFRVRATSASAATAAAAWPIAGHDLYNTRNNPLEHTISAANAGALVPRWTADVSSYLAATPAVAGAAVYLPDMSGRLWAFDAATGAVRWSHTMASYTHIAGDSARATPAVDSGRVVLGDVPPPQGTHDGAHLLAVSTSSGLLLWNTVVDSTRTAKITGPAVIDGATVYVGVSSSDEAITPCCSFRGSVVALDAATGAIKWRTYMAPPGYTGAAVWGGSPVVDRTTGLLYVGTGNNYSVPPGVCSTPAQTGCTPPDAADFVDSLVALKLTTGAPVWALRTLNADVAVNACQNTAVCGPDFDFGSAPNRFSATTAGVTRQLVGIGQKSGIYWAVDAVTGALAWQTRVGPGGSLGGIQWGSASDGARLYVAVTNSSKKSYVLFPSGQKTTGGAFSALDPATGRIIWQTADPQGAGDYGFVSSANGVVYGGSAAGTGASMYALNAATGRIVWRYASGGSVLGGAAIVDGTVYWASGYRITTCPATQPGCGSIHRLYAFSLPPAPGAAG